MNIYFEKTHQRAFGTFPLEGEVAVQAIQTAASGEAVRVAIGQAT